MISQDDVKIKLVDDLGRGNVHRKVNGALS